MNALFAKGSAFFTVSTALRGAVFSFLLLGVSESTALAQVPPPSPTLGEQLAAMGKLEKMIGKWEGNGWIDSANGRQEFRGQEIVQGKLRGAAILVEGSFFSRDKSTGADVPVHTTLGVISYDAKNKAYRFRTWLASGTAGEHELKLVQDGWQWEIKSPRGIIRYTTTFANETWLEIGEISNETSEWKKFFEMKLSKASTP